MEKQKKPDTSHSFPRRLILLLCGVLVAASAVYWFARSQAGALDEFAPPPGAPPDVSIGSENAPVTIIEYASMTCGFCAAFHISTLPLLKRDYIDKGKVRLVFREFPLDTWALAASVLARCAGPERYFDFIDVLFQHQRRWLSAQDRRAALTDIARQGGIGKDAYDACLSDQELLTSLQATKRHASEVLRVGSTPTLFIGKEKMQGNPPYGKLREVIERHLAGR